MSAVRLRSSIFRPASAIAALVLLAGAPGPARAQEYRYAEVERVELDVRAAPEVHGISTHFGGPLAVFVGPGERPRILHLSSQESADWRFYLLPGSRVVRIYVSGFATHGLRVVKASGEPDDGSLEVIDLGLNLRGHDTLSLVRRPGATMNPSPITWPRSGRSLAIR